MSAPPSRILQMHVVVEQPLTSISAGRISLRPLGRDPVKVQWSAPNGGTVQVDASGTEAYGVLPGRYKVSAVDAEGKYAEVHVDISPLVHQAAIVREYHVTPASNGLSRDGRVEAIGDGLDGVERFLWTHGCETTVPVLHDVPCGIYALTPLPSQSSGTRVLVHLCAPACVGIEGETQ